MITLPYSRSLSPCFSSISLGCLLLVLFCDLCYSYTLKIVISADETATGYMDLLYGVQNLPVDVHTFGYKGQNLKYLETSTLQGEKINKILFQFDDESEEICFDTEITKRVTQWLTQGWQNCISYIPSARMVMSETGKTYEESGLSFPTAPDAAVFIMFTVFGVTHFPCHPSEKNATKRFRVEKFDEKKLQVGDIIEVFLDETDLALYSAIYMGKRIVLCFEPAGGTLMFQDIEQLQSTWEHKGSVTLKTIKSLLTRITLD